VCMNIDDFAGHNHYHFLSGEPGGKWRWLGYDFDSGFTYGRVGALRALYGDGSNGDNPDWQRNKLCARVSANPTLRRIYLLTLRRMLNEIIREEIMFPRLDELFTLMTPDRQADAAKWGQLRSSTSEAKTVLTSQKQSLSNYLAGIGLPATNTTPQISPPGGQVPPGTTLTLVALPGWAIYYTTDGSDPRLSLSRLIYSGPITLSNSVVIKVAAIPSGDPPTSGNWTDLATADFVAVLRPQLFIVQDGAGIKLIWPASFSNQVLESVTNIQGAWSQVIATPLLVGDHFEVPQASSNSARFYRLRGQ